MFYRMVIIANLPGPPNPGIETALIQYLEREAINVNVGQPHEERTHARIEQCYHDETPTVPCVLVRNWQLPDTGP